MRALLLSQQHVLDERADRLVGAVEEDPDDRAGDLDDDRSLHDLGAPGPLDLLQLAPRLADEREAPRADAVGEGGSGLLRHRSGAGAEPRRARGDRAAARLLLAGGPARVAPLPARLAGH